MTQEEQLRRQIAQQQAQAAQRQPQRPSAPSAPIDRIMAGVIWCVGAYFSSVGIREFGVTTATTAFAIGITAQALLTLLQLRLGRTLSALGVVALVIDVWLNIGGIYPTLRNLGKTSSWQAISEALASTGRFENKPPSAILVLLLSLVFGIVIARGVEFLWRRNR